MVARLHLPRLDAEAWDAALTRVFGDDGKVPNTGDTSFVPTAWSLRAGELVLDEHTAHDVAASGTREGRTWRADLQARELAGRIEYSEGASGRAGKLLALIGINMIREAREADESCGRGKPFLQVVFTTSNHRPYTYPEGRIDSPSHTGRMGAVKYADYAVGAFVEEARTKPWFDNTLFVFVGDHGAGSAGKQALNPETHRIFSIFYAPALLKPERRDTPVSQIDVLPTLLGLLNWPYDAAFYGKDALKPSYQSRYFVSNYQYIGYLKGKDMVVLKPQRGVEFFRDGEAVEPDGRMKELEREAVYYYQHASGWRTSLKE